MKKDELVTLIKEAVKTAVLEVLSMDLPKSIAEKPLIDYTINSALGGQGAHTNKFVVNLNNKIEANPQKLNPLDTLMEQTRQSMTAGDYKVITAEDIAMASSNIPGENPIPSGNLDISNLDFVKKAALVYNKSIGK